MSPTRWTLVEVWRVCRVFGNTIGNPTGSRMTARCPVPSGSRGILRRSFKRNLFTVAGQVRVFSRKFSGNAPKSSGSRKEDGDTNVRRPDLRRISREAGRLPPKAGSEESPESTTCGTKTGCQRWRGKGRSSVDAEASEEGQMNLAPYVKPKGHARSCHGSCRACGSHVRTFPCPKCNQNYCYD